MTYLYRTLSMMIVCVLFAAGVQAQPSPDLFDTSPGMAYVRSQGLVTPTNASQTVNGLTLTVEQAYLDANQGALVLNISGAWQGATDNLALDMQLVDGNGQHLGHIRHMGGGGGGTSTTINAYGPALVVNEAGYGNLNLFDRPAGTINVTLTGTIQAYNRESGHPVSGPFTPVASYNIPFTVNFQGGTRIPVNQTANQNGIGIQVDAFNVSPSAMVTDFCFTTPAPDNLHWYNMPVSLTVDGQIVRREWLRTFYQTGGDCSSIYMDEHVNPSASTWTLAINGVTVRDDEAQVIQAFEARGIEASPLPGGGILLNTQHSGLSDTQITNIAQEVRSQTSRTISGNWTMTVNP